ncbi:WlaTC/HtrL family glycosyltransferase [Pectinatus brassicae]|uniref:Protein YibB n=1 Tax=Pectinatus brassicae TaxID=862415 RepID=A0A840USI6_9FIRM|nr:WlaTC/HtrL family glycosyltransferase [Pectinatus brassicae]MBB5335923.1 protein YibB [Pectinatus brassicae]
MSELTIVTAFFDIGRNNWSNSQRSSNKYIDYFKFWARIKNNLIIYTEKDFAEEIFNIRKSYGLENRTTVIVIDNFLNCDKEIYEKISLAMQSKIFRYFRKAPNNPESWNVKYNYITYLKSYFVDDAIKRDLAKGFIAWLDFGFNKNGTDDYPHTKEFDFLWQYDFVDKMHLFVIEDVGIDKPIFDIVKDMDSIITGTGIIGPQFLWPVYHNLCRESMISLTDCGFADDDQTIALMAYRKNPDIFKLYKTDTWLSWFKELGAEHLTIRPFKKKNYQQYKKLCKISLKEKKYNQAFNYYLNYLFRRFK